MSHPHVVCNHLRDHRRRHQDGRVMVRCISCKRNYFEGDTGFLDAWQMADPVYRKKEVPMDAVGSKPKDVAITDIKFCIAGHPSAIEIHKLTFFSDKSYVSKVVCRSVANEQVGAIIDGLYESLDW